MKVYLLSPPLPHGLKRVREGRCMAPEGVWTTLWPPISMASIAAVLEERGFTVKITDAGAEGIDLEGVKGILKDFSPDFLVINSTTPTIENDLPMSGMAKQVVPGLMTIAFGIHVSELPEESMGMEKSLDFIVRREPELTMGELLCALRDKGDLSSVSGISYRRDGEVVNNPESPCIEDLDSLPFPAWHLVDRAKYTLPYTRKQYLLITPARGCYRRCIFCVAKGYYGSRLRMRSIDSVIREIEWIGNEFGINNFLVWTESFTLKRKFVMDFCEALKEKKLQVSWVCNSRVDDVDPEMLRALKDAGCWMIGYGVESASQEILDNSKKDVTVGQIREACRMTKEAGIEVTGHIVVGLPGETKETARQTMRFARELDLDYAAFYCAAPWPGTEIYQMGKAKGWLRKDAPWSMYEQNMSILDIGNMKAEEVMKVREEAFRSFYLHPRTIYKTIRKIRSITHLKEFLRMVKAFLVWIKRSYGRK